jgi:sulfite exporter TauE/SafE
MINAFLLGLSTGVFCYSYCVPIYLPQLLSEKDKFIGWLVFLKFNLGRLISYIFIGAIFGWLGSQHYFEIIKIYTNYAIVILALILILFGLTAQVFQMFKFIEHIFNYLLIFRRRLHT